LFVLKQGVDIKLAGYQYIRDKNTHTMKNIAPSNFDILICKDQDKIGMYCHKKLPVMVLLIEKC